MAEIDVPIELVCDTCGSDLSESSTATRLRGVPCFRISACRTCLARAEDDATERGYRQGFEAGYKEGQEEQS